jgi:hypothetical protein
MDDDEPKPEDSFLPIPDWQQQILADRLADLDRNPEDEQTWEEVKAELSQQESTIQEAAGAWSNEGRPDPTEEVNSLRDTWSRRRPVP